MKWYNKAHHNIFLKQLRVDQKLNIHLERYVLRFSKLVFKHVRKTNLEEQKVGILCLQDIMQAGFSGLIEGWSNVDWDIIDGKPNGEKALINYLSSYIERQIKREIYRDATGVSIPEYLITKTKKEQLVDKLFGNWMYSFRLDDANTRTYGMKSYIHTIEWTPDSSKWENDELNDRLTTIMQPLRQLERDILMCHFGVGHKMSIKELAEVCDMSIRGVEDAKRRALKKLDTEENREFLKDFL